MSSVVFNLDTGVLVFGGAAKRAAEHPAHFLSDTHDEDWMFTEVIRGPINCDFHDSNGNSIGYQLRGDLFQATELDVRGVQAQSTDERGSAHRRIILWPGSACDTRVVEGRLDSRGG